MAVRVLSLTWALGFVRTYWCPCFVVPLTVRYTSGQGAELARRVCLALQGELSLACKEDGEGDGEYGVIWRSSVSGMGG